MPGRIHKSHFRGYFLLNICALLFMLCSVRADAFGNLLEGNSLENIVAFIRLQGYIEYFYAGDAASENNWDTFLAQHIEEVESAANPEILRNQLLNLFAPYVPELQLEVAGTQPSTAEARVEMPAEANYVTAWVRIGMGAGREGHLIAGRRIQVPVGTKTISYQDPVFMRNFQSPIEISIPDPSVPFVTLLNHELIASFPLSVYGNEQGTLPALQKEVPVSTGQPSERAMRLAIVGKAWNVFQHLFPYWEILNLNWENVLRQSLSEAATSDNENFITVLQRMTAYLEDGHTVTSRGQFTNAGGYALPFTWDVIEDQIIVTTLLAEDVPLQPGDIIIEIDGISVAELLTQELERVGGRGQYQAYLALLNLQTGAYDSTVRLTVRSPGAEDTEQIAVSRTYQSGSQRQFYWREYRADVTTPLADGIWYVDLTRITSGELLRIIPQLSTALGIIFDMRGYPNSTAPAEVLPHLTDSPLSLPPSFIPVFTYPDHRSVTMVDVTTTVTEPRLPRLHAPIVWLINGNGTYSYPETILEIVKGYQLGLLVGQPTAGASGNRVVVHLMNNYRTSWTGLYVTKFDGSPLFTIGVTPDVHVQRTIAGVARQEDELLSEALRIIESQLKSPAEN